MQTQTLSKLALIVVTIGLGGQAPGADLQFQHHFIDRSLPVTDKLVGDYGLTALVDGGPRSPSGHSRSRVF
jgi:hypothetical protein